MQHYYSSSQENLEHDYQTIQYTLLKQTMQFTTDNGVFSKKMIDYGSRALLASFEEPNVEGKILDVGCGYGTFGLTIAKAFDRDVELVDVNERALDLARGNARLNKVLDNVKIYQSNVYDQVSGQFAAIVTNPPIRAGKKVVHQILEEAFDYLKNQGELWVVIQKKQGAPSAKKKMQEIFGNCEIVSKDKGYYILKSQKSS